MDFVMLFLVTTVLFLRPADFFPQLGTVPFYQILIVPCLVLSAGPLLDQFMGDSLRKRPMTVCVLWLLPALVLTSLAHLDFEALGGDCVEYFKVVLYYLLLMGLVTTPGRLRAMIACVVVALVVLTGLSVLHYRGYINLPTCEAIEDVDEVDPATGELILVQRLRGPGMFHDPNDISVVICLGIMLCLCGAAVRRQGLLRLLWLIPIPLFGYALALTHSRGGFLALVAGAAVLLVTRFGVRRAVILGAALGPVFLALFGGRMTNISGGTTEGTGQSRIQLWLDGFALLFHSPLFGIGCGQFFVYCDHVAHNSYVQVATELGIFGAVPYIGIVYYALTMLYRLGGRGVEIADTDLREMRPYVAAAVTAYAVGMFSLTLCFNVPTFAVLGLAGSFIHMADPARSLPGSEFDPRLALRMAAVTVGALTAIYIFAKFNVRYT